MLVWNFPVRKRHAGLGDTADRGVSWVNTWRSRSPWGSPWWLSAEAVSLLVITWPFSCVKMTVTWTELPFPPVRSNYGFASPGRKPCVGHGQQSDLAQSFADARSQWYVGWHVCVGFLDADYWKACHCCWHVTWPFAIASWLDLSMYFVVEAISRNKKVAVFFLSALNLQEWLGRFLFFCKVTLYWSKHLVLE